MTLREAIQLGEEKLQASGISDYKLDSFYLLEYVSGISRAKYYAQEHQKISKEEQEKYFSLIEKRCKRIPLQHLTGTQEFMGLPFQVSPHVLIPRQDTELLVETALEVMRKLKDKYSQQKNSKFREETWSILDMCTGSGCILISTLRYGKEIFPNLTGTGVDISIKALENAKKNAQTNGLTEATFIQSDLFKDLSTKPKYELILSNPPYIPTGEIAKLEEEVKSHDPLLALDGKEDGLYFYRKIIKQSIDYLEDGGILIFECAWNQGMEISKMMKEQGFTDVEVIKDLAGLDRVVLGKYTYSPHPKLSKISPS